MRSLSGFLGFLLGVIAAGALGAWATQTSVHTWYPTLAKPAWTPPDWLFAPVWTALYLAMAVAGWRVWRRRTKTETRIRHTALAVWWVQLVLNAAWPLVFFGLRLPGPAAGVLTAWWLLLAANLVLIALVDRVALWLWVPYVIWGGYALALNVAIVRLN